jgi:hypothetical protein
MPVAQGPFPVVAGQQITLTSPANVRGVLTGGAMAIKLVLSNESACPLIAQAPSGTFFVDAFQRYEIDMVASPAVVLITPLTPAITSPLSQLAATWFGPSEQIIETLPISLSAQAVLAAGLVDVVTQQFEAATDVALPGGGQANIDLAVLPFPPGLSLANFNTAVVAINCSGGVPIPEGVCAFVFDADGVATAQAAFIPPTVENGDDIVFSTNSSIVYLTLATGGVLTPVPPELIVYNPSAVPLTIEVVLTQEVIPPTIDPPTAGSSLVGNTNVSIDNTTVPFGGTPAIMAKGGSLSVAIDSLTVAAGGAVLTVQLLTNAGVVMSQLAVPLVAGMAVNEQLDFPGGFYCPLAAANVLQLVYSYAFNAPSAIAGVIRCTVTY